MPIMLPSKNAQGQDVVDPCDITKTIITKVQAAIKHGADTLNNPEIGQQLATFESLSPIQSSSVLSTLQGFETDVLECAFEGFAPAEIGNYAKTAAIMAAVAAASNPSSYHQKYMNSVMSARNEVNEKYGIITFEHYGTGIDVQEAAHPDMQSFDSTNAGNMAGETFAYNLRTSVQNEFNEMFFKTVNISPDQGGMDVTVPNLNVFNHYLHNTSGAPADMKKRRLLEAHIDPTILANDTTTLIPEVAADNSNAEYFVPAAAVAPYQKEVGVRTVRTAPLLVGKKVNLMGVASGSLSVKVGQLDNLDALDGMVGIDKIYLRMGTSDVISFLIKDLPDSFFLKSPTGRKEEFFLNFNNISLQINANSKPIGAQTFTDTNLAAIVSGGYTVVLDLRLTGRLDREIGNCIVDAGTTVTVRKVYNNQDNSIALDDVTVADFVEAIDSDLEIIGWEPNARLTNTNRRIRGIQLDVTPWTDRYPVKFLAPISFPVPYAEPTAGDSQKINWLITAVNITNDNNGITKLLESCTQLEQYKMVPSTAEDQDVMDVEGILRMVIPRPWYKRGQIPVDKRINSLNTHDKLRDIHATIMNQICDLAFQMIRDTNIQNALDAFTGYSGKKMKVIIGTDPYIDRFIVSPHGNDELAHGLKFKKAVSYDRRIRGKIIVALSLDVEGFNIFNHGSFLNMPALVSTLQVSRGQPTFREIMVQPRNRHIIHAPFKGMFEVTGLEKTLVGGVPLRVINKVATSNVFEDVVSP